MTMRGTDEEDVADLRVLCFRNKEKIFPREPKIMITFLNLRKEGRSSYNCSLRS